MEDVHHRHQKSVKHGEFFEEAIEVGVGVKMPSLVIVCLLVWDILMDEDSKWWIKHPVAFTHDLCAQKRNKTRKKNKSNPQNPPKKSQNNNQKEIPKNKDPK